ncbi:MULTISPECIES: LacI family DNA-binding transcriptional regulator [Paraburkholderia]|uniref:LacI family DNA-binding transcriptional regulator n=1 Tax=Paraburkholderia ferrariae TaxID=386056 RepID=A0ABU9S385_9BURK
MESLNGRRPTVIDVAKRAGVSKSTAARVLSDAPNISASAREQVLLAAKALGYTRNELAVSMRSGRSGMLGLVLPDIANPFWGEVARGAQDRAADAGVSILIFSSNWSAEKERMHLSTMMQARVDGAIINPVADELGDLERFGLPCIMIGSSAERFPDSASIGSDIAQGVALGMDYLRSQGHLRPALIVGQRTRLARARFLRAVHEHCIKHDIDPVTLPVEDADYTTEGGALAMRRLLERHEGGHLCVFAANDLMALGAMGAVRETGLHCPQDVSILGFDGIQAGAFAWPGLTTIEKPARQIGAEAVAQLLKRDVEAAQGSRIYLPCTLTERGSIADLRRKLMRDSVASGERR